MKSETYKTTVDPRIWRWGSLNLSAWAGIVYLAFLFAFGFSGWPGYGEKLSFPIYDSEAYVQGTYPLFWLVYIWLPLFMRDFYVHRKHREPAPREFWLQVASLAALSAPAYYFVFGWF